MRRPTFISLSILAYKDTASLISAQTDTTLPEKNPSPVSLFEYAAKIPKRNKVFNLNLELHAGFYADFYGGKLDEASRLVSSTSFRSINKKRTLPFSSI